MLKSLILLALRLTTGLLLIIWGLIKVAAPANAIEVSHHFYRDLLSAKALQMPLGVGQIVLGGLVVLGLARKIAYPLQALVLGLGAAAIWKYLADPLGLYLLPRAEAKVLFFPSSTVFIASLVMLAFRADDRFALDALLSGGRK